MVNDRLPAALALALAGALAAARVVGRGLARRRRPRSRRRRRRPAGPPAGAGCGSSPGFGHGIASPASQAGGRPLGTLSRITNPSQPNQIISASSESAGTMNSDETPSAMPRVAKKRLSRPDPHRLQGHVDHRHDQPEERREEQVRGDVEDRCCRRSGRRAACRRRRRDPPGRRSPRRPGSGRLGDDRPGAASRIGPMKTKPTIAPLTRSLRAWAARNRYSSERHEREEGEAAQRDRGEQLAGSVVDRPVALGVEARRSAPRRSGRGRRRRCTAAPRRSRRSRRAAARGSRARGSRAGSSAQSSPGAAAAPRSSKRSDAERIGM